MGRLLIAAGLLLVALGVILVFAEKLPFKFGKLPGDIIFRGKSTTVYFPLTTSILLSVLLSLVMWLLNRRR